MPAGGLKKGGKDHVRIILVFPSSLYRVNCHPHSCQYRHSLVYCFVPGTKLALRQTQTKEDILQEKRNEVRHYQIVSPVNMVRYLSDRVKRISVALVNVPGISG